MTTVDRLFKRIFDIMGSLLGLFLTGWVILIAWVVATIDTGQNGFFRQARVGKDGHIFNLIKIRTMRPMEGVQTCVTSTLDPRITKIGRLLRRFKVDELPQLWNVLKGDMSLVGPRPDVKGFADTLEGEDRIILALRPGITGPATLKYRDEERTLARLPNPEKYNQEVIWRDKVLINRLYVSQYSFWNDMRYILMTLLGRHL